MQGHIVSKLMREIVYGFAMIVSGNAQAMRSDDNQSSNDKGAFIPD